MKLFMINDIKPNTISV